ncbi:MAG: glucokinase [Candidatus Dadabacteria bacterium]
MILKIANNKTYGSTDILAADIGASKIEIAIYHWNGNHLFTRKHAIYKTKNFPGITSVIAEFIQQEELPSKICLAVAGPVQDSKVTLTNLNWTIDGEQLSQQLNRPVFLINDLQATCYGLSVLDEKEIHVIHKGIKDPKGNMAIISPGTGLGEAGLYYDDNGYHPFASEGGHCDFAPRTEEDIEILLWTKKKFRHVSWERIVSGPGICTIYDFLLQVKERDEPSWIKEKILSHDKAMVISQNAMDCPLCKETIDLFTRYLAIEAANLALKMKATAGVFIGGGIVPDLIADLNQELFIRYFIHSGRMQHLLESVPVHIILNKQATLAGAAYFGALQKTVHPEFLRTMRPGIV